MRSGFSINSDPVGIHTGAELYPPRDAASEKIPSTVTDPNGIDRNASQIGKMRRHRA